MNLKLVFSNMALVMVFVVGIAYISTIVGEDPRGGRTVIHVDMPVGGGLQERSNVSIRGVVVGRVEEVHVHGSGVRATLSLDRGARIPADSDVQVGSLSLAGEQYVDFRPAGVGGPYFRAGTTVSKPVKTPVSIAQVMGHLVELGDQVDPDDLRTIVDESAIALGDGAADDVAATIQNSREVLDAMESSWESTESLIDESHDVLGLVEESANDMRPAMRDANRLARAVRSSDDDIEMLLARGPNAITNLTRLGEDLAPRLTRMLPDLDLGVGTIYERIPALALIFPELDFAARAVAHVFYDSAIHILADVPHLEKPCVTGLPTRPPTMGGNPPPYLYAYCQLTSDTQQIRGAARAPRPPGDHTDVAPPGVRGDERADPLE